MKIRVEFSTREKQVIEAIKKKNQYVVQFVLLVTACTLLAAYAMQSYNYLDHRYEVNLFESHDFGVAYHLYQGDSIYPDMQEYPFLENPYTPVYFVLSALAFHLYEPSIPVGRLVSILASVVIFALIFWIVFRHGGSIPLALFAASLPVTSPYFFDLSGLLKVDTLTIAFAVAGLAVVNKTTKSAVWASLFFVLAMYTKQSAISAPAAAFIYYLIYNRKAALILFLMMASIGGGLFLMLNWITEGHFYNHVIVYTAEPGFHWPFLKRFYMGLFINQQWGFLLFGLVALCFWMPLWGLYAVISVLAAMSIAKVGAYWNHFMEPYVAVSICVGLVLWVLAKKHSLLQLGALLYLGGWFLWGQDVIKQFDIGEKDPAQNFYTQQTISDIVAQTKGEVLSEYSSYVLYNNRPFHMHAQTLLFLKRIWDKRLVTQDINNKKFDLIISKTTMKPLIGEEIGKHYKKALSLSDNKGVHGIGRWELYIPLHHAIESVYPDRLPLIFAPKLYNRQGFGKLAYNQSVSGQPLSLGGSEYVMGLGTHAKSTIVFKTLGYDRFTALAGIDGFQQHSQWASVIIRVKGDDKTLWSSGVMTSRTLPEQIDVDISGFNKLTIEVNDANKGQLGNKIKDDHVSIVNPFLIKTKK